MHIDSPAFPPEGDILAQYTCEGADTAPPLRWSGVPAGTRSLALIVDDPDAPDPDKPQRTWVHWVMYDLPPQTASLPEGGRAPEGARDGLNDWKRTGYGGPCPPIGKHRYFFKLYALDTQLTQLQRATKAQLEAAMKGHILAQAQMIGRYQKHKGGK